MSLALEFVEPRKLTTIMVTYNMEQAIALGNRLVMMHKGKVIYELSGEEKWNADVSELIDLFSQRYITDDELLLERIP
ncbi:hypothetical protein KAU37_00980 [Candidatus Bipolaricaulota bacterium]|nr:hypothetical protein [Candidatus Bipolaricaulota bacterium]